MAFEVVMSDEEAKRIARGFLDHQKEIENREQFERDERLKKRELDKYVTLSTGKKINLENINYLMSTTGNELDELCLILKTRRLSRELKQIRIENDLLDDEELQELKLMNPFKPDINYFEYEGRN